MREQALGSERPVRVSRQAADGVVCPGILSSLTHLDQEEGSGHLSPYRSQRWSWLLSSLFLPLGRRVEPAGSHFSTKVPAFQSLPSLSHFRTQTRQDHLRSEKARLSPHPPSFF